jgi:hypothetical protein
MTRIGSPSLSTQGVDLAALDLAAGVIAHLVVAAARFSADLIDGLVENHRRGADLPTHSLAQRHMAARPRPPPRRHHAETCERYCRRSSAAESQLWRRLTEKAWRLSQSKLSNSILENGSTLQVLSKAEILPIGSSPAAAAVASKRKPRVSGVANRRVALPSNVQNTDGEECLCLAIA